MIISNIRIQHLTNPVGWDVRRPNISWTTEDAKGTRQKWAKVEISEAGTCVFSEEGEELSSLSVAADIDLKPRTRYDVTVTVEDETGDRASGTAFFETGKAGEEWRAKWITAPFEKDVHPVITYKMHLPAKPVKGRLYGVGFGICEITVNGRRASSEVLAPFYNDYNNWIQAETYDITDLLRQGENTVECSLGKGWYMGRFGFGAGGKEMYGSRMKLLLEGHAALEDGTEASFATGEGEWLCKRSETVDSSIYDGEVIDMTLDPGESVPALVCEAPEGPVTDRLSPPVHIVERLAGAKLILTPKGERVLDFGQVMTGWVEFLCEAPKGTKVYLQYGELLQDECFYRENLRSALAEFTYISDGERRLVRPRFTFYGFRYVKVEGLDYVDPRAFTACVIHSDVPFTGSIKMGNAKLDRLFENAFWSQRGNFLDTPTDCPQRDERMGWTGDAQVFAPTACYNMYTPAFYRKYLHDMLLEQRKLDGSVPFVVPDVLSVLHRFEEGPHGEHGSCAWADAASVIPWTVYRFYGDKELLKEEYENMTLWAEWIHRQDEGDFLWRKGFHFADWLALDNPDKGSSFGGTDPYYIASVYYYYTTLLCAKAAKVLGYRADEEKYASRASSIADAIRREYFTPTGRIAVPTQTAMALSLYFDIAPDPERTARDLCAKLEERKVHLDTGFVGTYFLLPVLTKIGRNDLAVQLLLNEDYPSWLYEVNMGATTIWERWNSVLPDGHVSDTGMNSMNHYAYGSVMEWVYSVLCGLKPSEDGAGFKKAVIRPYADKRLHGIKCEYLSAAGRYRSAWERREGSILYHVEVPFDANAEFIPPDEKALITVNGKETKGRQTLLCGAYDIVCPDPEA